MDIVYLIILAAAGVGFGAFLPELCDKTAAYMLNKSGTTLEPNRFFSSWATKLFMGVCNGAAWYLLGLVFVSVSSLIIACVIVYCAFLTGLIDIRVHIIPNEAVMVFVVLGLLFQVLLFGFKGGLLAAIISMFVMMAVFLIVGAIMGFDKVGAGDVKLAGAMGAILGYPNILYGVVVMAASMILFAVVGFVIKKVSLRSMVPFAPFMSLGIICGCLATLYRIIH